MPTTLIRPKDLSATAGVSGSHVIPVDNGSTVDKATVTSIYDAMAHVVNVRDTHGADHTGAADSSAQFTAAILACPSKGVIFVPDGTYIIDNINVNKDISFRLAPGATLKHKAASAGPMIRYTVPATGFFECGTLDGNAGNQPALVANWNPLLKTNTATAFEVRGVTFTGFHYSGIYDTETTGRLRITRCNFRNGVEHGGVLGLQSSGINLSLLAPNSKPHASITDCNFWQDSAPSVAGKNPGGCIIAGNEVLGCYPSVKFSGNYCYQIGQNFALNSIGAIDLYEDTANSIVEGNHFINCFYSPVKLQNCSQVICRGNVVNNTNGGDGTQGIWIDPHQRSQTTGTREPFIVSGNTVIGRGTGEGIRVFGSVALSRKAILADNHIESCGKGIYVGGGVGWDGPLSISGNTILAIAGNGLEFTNTNASEIRVTNNHIEANIGILGTTGVNNTSFFLSGNYSESLLAGSYALVFWGPSKLHCYSGFYKNDGSGVAVNFQADGAGNKIGELMFPKSNVIGAGFNSVTYTDVLKVIGSDYAILITKAQRNQIATPANGLRIDQADATPGIRIFSNGAWVKYTETIDA